jgi:hypothetical protein
VPFYRSFAAAGGLLLSGSDLTGSGDVLSGLGDQREIELPMEAQYLSCGGDQDSTLNGAVHLGKDKQIGSVAVGENADPVAIKPYPI